MSASVNAFEAVKIKQGSDGGSSGVTEGKKETPPELKKNPQEGVPANSSAPQKTELKKKGAVQMYRKTESERKAKYDYLNEVKKVNHGTFELMLHGFFSCFKKLFSVPFYIFFVVVMVLGFIIYLKTYDIQNQTFSRGTRAQLFQLERNGGARLPPQYSRRGSIPPPIEEEEFQDDLDEYDEIIRLNRIRQERRARGLR